VASDARGWGCAAVQLAAAAALRCHQHQGQDQERDGGEAVLYLLQSVDNDVDLANPDQVRIAVWCWGKLMADREHRDEYESGWSELLVLCIWF
jgi:hypothetical protein